MPKNEKHDLLIEEVFCHIWHEACVQIIDRAQTIQAADEDIELVHQYRIALRKARSILLFMKPLLKEAFFSQANEQLKQCAAHFAKVREWDVILEYYQNEYLNQVNEIAEQSRLLILEHKRIREVAYTNYDFNQVETLINAFHCDITMDYLKHKAHTLTFTHFVSKRAKILKKHIDQKAKQLKPNDYKRMHAYRIANKRLRYALESINPIFELAFDKQIKRLKAKTDVLGRSCDLFFMYETLSELQLNHSESKFELKELVQFIEREMTKNKPKP